MRPNTQTITFSVAIILIAVAVALSLTACNKSPGAQQALGGANPHLHRQDGSKADPSQAVQALDLSKLGAAADDALFSTPEDQHKTLILAIQNATTSVDVVNYHLSDENVVEALKTAAASKVKVRVLLDQSILAKNQTAQDIMKDLSSSGVDVKKSSKAFSITHQKSIVIDTGIAGKQKAFITTMNLTTLSAQTRDFGLQTQDSTLISEIEAVFGRDFNVNKAKNTGENPNLTQQRLVWSPVNSKNKILQLINSAKTSIDIEMENFGENEVANALVSKAKAGITVRTLSPGCVAGAQSDNLLPNKKIIDQLTAGGVNARVGSPDVDASHPYIHAKMILVDGELFYLGSENLSMNSLMKARELGILTDDKGMANQLAEIFQQDLDVSVDPSTVTAESCQKASGPYSQSGDETMDMQNETATVEHQHLPKPAARPQAQSQTNQPRAAGNSN